MTDLRREFVQPIPKAPKVTKTAKKRAKKDAPAAVADRFGMPYAIREIRSTMGGPGDAPTSPAPADSWMRGTNMAQRILRGARRYSNAESGRIRSQLALMRLVTEAEAAAVKPDGCWNWPGTLRTDGYGLFAGKLAHRVVYEALVGPIPEGLELDHLCRNHSCVNPWDLEPVTHEENIRRGESPWAQKARQTHCKYGHEFTPENTYRRGDTGSRMCRKCHMLKERVRKAGL